MKRIEKKEAKKCEKRHCAAVALATIMMLFIAAVLFTSAVVAETEPDYTFEEELPADGSNDTAEEYEIIREDETNDGYIKVEAYVDAREVHIELENIQEIKVYFDEMGLNLEDYKTQLRMVSTDIDIIITSDTDTLDGEFHGVPEPSEVNVDTNWLDSEYEDGVFSFEGLETSTTTITFSYNGLLGFEFGYWLFSVLWYLFYIGLVINVFRLIFENYIFELDEYK